MVGVNNDKYQQRARAAVRDLYPTEFEELRAGNSYAVAMRLLRDRHWEVYETELQRALDADSRPLVPAGRATCFACGGRLLEHRIGQCRPRYYG